MDIVVIQFIIYAEPDMVLDCNSIINLKYDNKINVL